MAQHGGYEEGWKTLARNEERAQRRRQAMAADAAAERGRRQLRGRRSI